MRKVYLWLCIVITALLALWGAFFLQISYVRLWEAVKDFGTSIAFYFCELFEIEHNIAPSVLIRSDLFNWGVISPNTSLPGTPPPVLAPENWAAFWERVQLFFKLFFDLDYFQGWASEFLTGMTIFLQLLTLFVLVAVLGYVIIVQNYEKENQDHNEDSVFLKIFKNIAAVLYQPAKAFVLGFINYVKRYKWIWTGWLILLALNLNIATVVVEFIAYYFYFMIEFDVVSLYTQFVKLFDDAGVILYNFPWWCVGAVVWLLFSRWRANRGVDRLRHMNAINMGFIKSLPVVVFICGLMGSGKTLLMSSMAANEEVMQRQQAEDILMETDMKFPFFPWISFEDDLRKQIDEGNIRNKAMAQEWVKAKAQSVDSSEALKAELYGYDYRRYGLEFYTGIKSVDIFEALETYAQAYYVYIFDSSLIAANYSIRSDNRMIDRGNFPIWAFDLFHEGVSEARYAHVIDFDAFRLGNKLVEDNCKYGSFEFGVVAITEIGKERGNQIELSGKKKTAFEANQKNDLFNSYLKMSRHGATIDNKTFVKIFADEQRPESWGADARELADVIHVRELSEARLSLPLYTIEDMLTEWAYKAFKGLYKHLRGIRGDNTLLIHVLKAVVVFMWKRDYRLKQRYGYKVATLERERGALDGKFMQHTYFIPFAQAFRYESDCYSEFFHEKALESGVGLWDWPEFAGERATVKELLQMNSYFVNDLYGGSNGRDL